MKKSLVIVLLILISVIFISGCVSEGSKDCVTDDDCVVFGKTGDCNCGCYNKDNLPSSTGGECFCSAPVDCKCVDGKCEGIFEGDMSYSEARQIAEQSECVEEGNLTEGGYFVANSWWIKMDVIKEGCNMVCAVNTITKEAHIDWRCLGAIPEPVPPVQEGITPEECADADGRVVNTADGFTCEENEISVGEVGGFAYLHLCCVPFPESKKLTIEEAMEIAQNSECMEKGDLTDNYVYNEHSKTWWIDLGMKEKFEKEYCNPACVVYEFTKTAEINWRCMGALPPE